MSEHEKNENRQPNYYYYDFMDQADRLIREAFSEARQFSGRQEVNDYHKDRALKAISKAMAYGFLADQHGFGSLGPEHDNDPDMVPFGIDELRDQVPGLMEKIQKTSEFQALLGTMSAKELARFTGVTEMGGKGDGRYETKPLTYTQFTGKYLETVEKNKEQIRQFAREEALKERMSSLVSDLAQSTQKSFTGKLKNIFSGNSELYKDALGAMKKLASGEIRNPQDMQRAKDAIESYVINRGGKVRDHQYGRDRFDAFMKGLGEIMSPEEFRRTCVGLNETRRSNGEQRINPEDYLMTPEKKAAFRKAVEREQKRAAAEKQSESAYLRQVKEESDREAQQKAEAEQKAAESAKQLKDDENSILKDDAARGRKDSNGLSLTERNQYDLDRLRRYKAEDLADYNNANVRKSIENRLRQHPSFRLAAQEIIREKGMEKLFKIPETHPEKMSPQAAEKLGRQVKSLQALDRQKHPDMEIKDVKVEQPEKMSKGPEI